MQTLDGGSLAASESSGQTEERVVVCVLLREDGGIEVRLYIRLQSLQSRLYCSRSQRDGALTLMRICLEQLPYRHTHSLVRACESVCIFMCVCVREREYS